MDDAVSRDHTFAVPGLERGARIQPSAGVKQLVSKRFSVSAAPDEPLSTYAHEIHAGIDSRTIREETALDW